MAFSKRLRALAAPLVIPEPVATSSRRWEQRGIVRTVLQMWWLRLAYWLALHRSDCGVATMAERQTDVLVVQFSREPVAGRVKTRMLGALSASAACGLHGELTLWTLQRLLDWGRADIELSVAGDPQHALFAQALTLGEISLTTQADGDLGQRMYKALRSGLAAYARVLLVGSDCPQIDPLYLDRAANALTTHDLVLGPATDGGYVLIGARRVDPALFEGVLWGSDQVFAQTIERAGRLGIEWIELEPLSDIDRPEDLSLWYSLREAGTAARGGN